MHEIGGSALVAWKFDSAFGCGCETVMDFVKQPATKAAVGADTHRVLCTADITTAADVMKKPSGAKRKTSQLAYHNKCFWLNV